MSLPFPISFFYTKSEFRNFKNKCNLHSLFKILKSLRSCRHHGKLLHIHFSQKIYTRRKVDIQYQYLDIQLCNILDIHINLFQYFL